MLRQQRWRRVNDLPSLPNFELVIILKLLLLSRDVNNPRLCYVNKDGGGVNDLHCKPKFDLLLF